MLGQLPRHALADRPTQCADEARRREEITTRNAPRLEFLLEPRCDLPDEVRKLQFVLLTDGP